MNSLFDLLKKLKPDYLLAVMSLAIAGGALYILYIVITQQ